MEKTEVDIKDTIKLSKVRMTGPTNESDPRIQLTAHVEGMMIHVFTMHESKWGKSKEQFQEDMKYIKKSSSLKILHGQKQRIYAIT